MLVDWSRPSRHNAKAKTHSRIDLLFANILENMPVSVVSNIAIIKWNQHPPYHLKNLFSFANANLHDNNVLLFMHPNDPELTKDING